MGPIVTPLTDKETEAQREVIAQGAQQEVAVLMPEPKQWPGSPLPEQESPVPGSLGAGWARPGLGLNPGSAPCSLARPFKAHLSPLCNG